MMLCISAGNFDPLIFFGSNVPWNLENTHPFVCQKNDIVELSKRKSVEAKRIA